MELSVLARIDAIERRVRIYRAAFLFSLIALAFAIVGTVKSAPESGGIIRAKALIITDSQGHPRIIMGAPAPTIGTRTRRDALYGVAYLDQNGVDRLTLGQEPNPMTADGIEKRRTGGVGLLINDQNGIERGGYGVLDDGTALLTLDWPKTGEAVALSASDQFSGVGLFHKNKPGVYRDALTFGVIPKDQQSFLKITGTDNEPLLKVETDGNQNPKVVFFDKNGKEMRSKSLRAVFDQY